MPRDSIRKVYCPETLLNCVDLREPPDDKKQRAAVTPGITGRTHTVLHLLATFIRFLRPQVSGKLPRIIHVGMFVYIVEIGLLPSDEVSLHHESRKLISPTIDHDLAQTTGLLQ